MSEDDNRSSYEQQFDLAGLTYPQFTAFFFDRPVVDDDRQFDLFHHGIDSFAASDPRVIASHIQSVCTAFRDLTAVYSPEQLDQGLWAILGPGLDLLRFLFDPSIELERRIACIEAMRRPFEEVVARRSSDVRETVYWMWWDLILHELWGAAGDEQRDYAALSNDSRAISDEILKTLKRIMDIDDWGCQQCALHGLGHLRHPDGAAIVQQFLDAHRTALGPEDLQWVEACRDGRVL